MANPTLPKIDGLEEMRQRIFDLETTIYLSRKEFDVLWPWLRSLYGSIYGRPQYRAGTVNGRLNRPPKPFTTQAFGCRAARSPKGRPARNGGSLHMDKCEFQLSIKTFEDPLEEIEIYRSGKKKCAHTHSLEYSDLIFPPSPIRQIAAVMERDKKTAVNIANKMHTPTTVPASQSLPDEHPSPRDTYGVDHSSGFLPEDSPEMSGPSQQLMNEMYARQAAPMRSGQPRLMTEMFTEDQAGTEVTKTPRDPDDSRPPQRFDVGPYTCYYYNITQ